MAVRPEDRGRVRRSRLRTLLVLSPWVFGSVALTVLALHLARPVIAPMLTAGVNDVLGNALQTLGTVYAVLLAFVVVVVWGQFNDARAAVEREANSVADLHRVLSGLSEPVRSQSQRLLREYLDDVLDEEWPAMVGLDEHTTAALSADLEVVWRALCETRASSERESLFLAEALMRFNDLSDARSLRLSSARVRMPFALRALVYLGGLMTVGLVFFQSLESFSMHALAAGSLAGAIAHVIYVVEDLDDAFSGDFQVPRAPFIRVRTFLDGG